MRSVIAFIASVSILSFGCDSKVRQQQPPEIPEAEPGEADMVAAPEETVAPAEETPELSEEEQRAQCCKVCADAAAADTSGDPPGALNCATIASGDSACVLYFDRNPMTGGEAQKCVEEAAGSEGEEGTDEGAAPEG